MPPIYLPKLASISAVLALTACGFSSDNSSGGKPLHAGSYDVRIVRTQMGIPHITANDFGSLGYGQAYAFAEDNLCVMMEDFVTSRGERSRYFGADGSYRHELLGSETGNVNNDFFWKFMADDAAVQRTRNKTEPQFRELVTGYVAGFNRYIAELKAGKHPGRHADCAKGDWLQPIDEADMYRRSVRLSILASSSVFANEIGSAQPPSALTARSTKSAQRLASVSEKRRALAKANPFLVLQKTENMGSNMYAIGKDGSASGQPIVLVNPHLPWIGTLRFYTSHNIIPGKLNIMGTSLYGVPVQLMGFNDKVAWAHTVSRAWRFTPYELKLNPLNPTQYFYEGALRNMTAVPLKVQAKQADGSLVEVKRTLYKSHFGPMFTLSASGVPILPWSNIVGYTLRDANHENDRLINHYGYLNMATSLDEFMSLHKSILGAPWVNIAASGPNGRVHYGDISVVPHVTNEKVTSCALSAQGLLIDQLAPGLPLLDGSRAACEWGTDADAPVPGIFGSNNLPSLVRDDYVQNCNDSHWLTNPKAPITGFNRIIGTEGKELSLRTRICILQAERRLAGTDGHAGTTFTIPVLQDIVLSSQIYSVELARKQVLDDLCTQPLLIGSAGPIAAADQAAACDVLSKWDGKDTLTSVGSHIWREFFRRAVSKPGGLPVSLPTTPLTNIWKNAFSVSDPVNTPNTLNTNNLQVQLAFADGIAAVKASGIPFDRPLGQIQYSAAHKNSRIPMFGGESGAGAFTNASPPGTGDVSDRGAGESLTKEGYGIIGGNTYVMTVTWDAKGQPQAEGLMTYSQSTDPASPHYDDFTKAYLQKQWQKFPFSEADIRKQKISELRLKE